MDVPHSGRGARRADGDAGFTLLELLVVVLIIAILLAIAIPTFLGAREAAWDRAAQSNVRNAHTTSMIFYSDDRVFTANALELQEIDPALAYNTVSPASLSSGAMVYVELATTSRPNDTVYLAGRSGSGRCYWLRTVGDENQPRFAENDCAATPAAAVFTGEW